MAHVLMLFNQHNTSGIDPVPNIQCISANEIEDDRPLMEMSLTPF